MAINVLLYSPIKSITRQGINSKDGKLEMKFHFFKDVSVRRQMYFGFPFLGYNNFR